MKSRVIAVVALVVVGIVIAWNALFFGPAGDDVTKATTRVATAQQQQSQFATQLRALEAIAKRGPEFQAAVDKLNSAVPLKADQEGFLRSADAIKTAAGVDWVSIAAAPPTLGASGPSEIGVQVVVIGGFFQVLDYLNRFEALRRLVVIDSLTVTAGDTSTTAAGGAKAATRTAKNGAPTLTVNLTARIFTQAPAPNPGGKGARSTASGSTSGSTPTQGPTATSPSVPNGSVSSGSNTGSAN